MGIKSKESKQNYEEKKRKKFEEMNKREKEKKIKAMGEMAFRQWLDTKKNQDIMKNKKQKDKPLTYEERQKQYRDKNIKKSKTTDYLGRQMTLRKKSKSQRRKSKKKQSIDSKIENKPNRDSQGIKVKNLLTADFTNK